MVNEQRGRYRPLPEPVRQRDRRPAWRQRLAWAGIAVAYAVGGWAAHLRPEWLDEATLTTYGISWVAGLAFIARYARTDWRAHPWGRHVMAFMVCLELLFTLALSRRVFGQWPGLPEAGFLVSATFAGVMVWRYVLQEQHTRRNRD